MELWAIYGYLKWAKLFPKIKSNIWSGLAFILHPPSKLKPVSSQESLRRDFIVALGISGQITHIVRGCPNLAEQKEKPCPSVVARLGIIDTLQTLVERCQSGQSGSYDAYSRFHKSCTTCTFIGRGRSLECSTALDCRQHFMPMTASSQIHDNCL